MNPVLRFLLRGALFVLLPLAVLEVAFRVAEPFALRGPQQLINFYGRADRVAAREPIDVLFVGSSRVAASVNDSTFRAEMAARTGDTLNIVKQGKGYSTPAVHYLAIRNLIEDHPQSLQGVTVFIEAPTGLPDMETWEDAWANENWPELLAPHLRPGDYGRYITQAAEDKETKLTVLGGNVLLVARYWEFMRNKFQAELKKRMEPKPEEVANADLTTDGGIRTDSAGIALTIQIARNLTHQIHAGEQVTTDWNQTILADLVRLIRAQGGDVVFFDVPLSSYGIERFNSPVRRQSVAHFLEWTAANNLRFVRIPTFACVDSDFPDLMHLRKSYSPEFTRQLVASYLSDSTATYADGRAWMCASPPPTDLIPPRIPPPPDGWLTALLKMFGAVSDTTITGQETIWEVQQKANEAGE